MTSIIDVAKKAGVSVTTVSRVLNNGPHPVNEKTRERVIEAAKELGFAPSALARALVKEKTNIIGILVGDASDPYFANIIRGISEEAREHGYLTLVCNTDRVVENEINFINLLRDYRADGIIFAGGGLTDLNYILQVTDLVSQFVKRGVPVVVLGPHGFDAPTVTIDNVGASRDMTEYLIGLGHRRIGLIAGPENLTTSQIRIDGYRKALKKHKIAFEPALVMRSDFTYESGLQLAEQIVSLEQRPTAIFGSNDLSAIGCLAGLKQRGIKVPGQISVVGFDDIAAAQYVDPPLTTVRVPMHEMGKLGMKHLIEAIQGDPIDQLYELPYELVVRASSAPSPALD